MSLSITITDLDSRDFVALIDSHNSLMLEHSPPESSHALMIDGLKATGISVWSLFVGTELVGCGALKMLSHSHGEIKSMHTVSKHRGKGYGGKMLEHIIDESKRRGCLQLSLETGSQPGFLVARKFYESYGFKYCGPFGDYLDDSNSVYMTIDVSNQCCQRG